MKKYILNIETLLGLGLGFGYMTSLRFLGPVGVSEIFILFSILLLFKKFYFRLFNFGLNFKGFIKGYLFASIFLIAPLVTLAVYSSSDLPSTPIYILSFIMGWMLSFLLVEAIDHGFDMSKMTFWFALVFISTNLITFLFFPQLLEEVRYTGAAENPNQLLFYATSLSLLVILYQKKLAFLLIPSITYITVKTGSDAYLLTLFITIFAYLYFSLFFYTKINFKIKIILNIIFFFTILYWIQLYYSENIINIWKAADQGGTRTILMLNALDVVLQAPLIGYGYGSFSGIIEPFEGWEAHNTFLDFSMQFGVIFPILIYTVFFVYLFKLLKNKNFFIAAFVLAFIVSGFFHFTGRHFNFWVEFAIFYSYIFSKNKQIRLTKGNVKCVV